VTTVQSESENKTTENHRPSERIAARTAVASLEKHGVSEESETVAVMKRSPRIAPVTTVQSESESSDLESVSRPSERITVRAAALGTTQVSEKPEHLGAVKKSLRLSTPVESESESCSLGIVSRPSERIAPRTATALENTQVSEKSESVVTVKNVTRLSTPSVESETESESSTLGTGHRPSERIAARAAAALETTQISEKSESVVAVKTSTRLSTPTTAVESENESCTPGFNNRPSPRIAARTTPQDQQEDSDTCTLANTGHFLRLPKATVVESEKTETILPEPKRTPKLTPVTPDETESRKVDNFTTPPSDRASSRVEGRPQPGVTEQSEPPIPATSGPPKLVPTTPCESESESNTPTVKRDGKDSFCC
jgi:hypothetical protein